MNVFVVTCGSYSSYAVLAVFSCQEKAEAYEQLLIADGIGETEITQRAFDPAVPALQDGYANYRLTIFPNGKTANIEKLSSSEMNEECALVVAPPAGVRFRQATVDYLGRRKTNPAVGIEFDISAPDEQAAIKIANEKRFQVLAANLWPQPKQQPADPDWAWYGPRLIVETEDLVRLIPILGRPEYGLIPGKSYE